jgi:hypothetical protein
MRILLITYELKNKLKDYSSFFEAVKNNAHQWWHFLPYVYIVATSYSANEYANFLLPHIQRADNLLVVRITAEHQGWLPKDAWDWLNDKQY